MGFKNIIFMKFKNLILLLVLAFTFTTIVVAEKKDLQQDPNASIKNAYRAYKDVDNISIKVPTVVEIPFVNDFIERFDFAVLNKTTNSFEPYYFKQETLTNEIPVSVSAIPDVDSAENMIDKSVQTYADFLLPENIQGQAQITLSSQENITSSTLTVLLDNNVALPNSIEIRALVGGQNRIVVASQRMYQTTVHFPKTTSNKWQIILNYGQPLRISELRLTQDNAKKSSNRAVRFLAQPNHSYRIYFDPDRYEKASVGEAGNLSSAEDVFVISKESSQKNLSYVIADIDNDSVPDVQDNCVSINNSDQKDVNNNGRGDVCDDFDQDGLINSEDNCPNNPNRDQGDADGDRIGDVCDGEESRITERSPWIPWVGMGFAAIVLIILLALTARSTFIDKESK